MTEHVTIPARRILRKAEATNRQLGHENLGSLSEADGFLPSEPPLRQLPTTHIVWDEIAAQLPELYHTFALRQVLDKMPLLNANVDALPDRYLLRAVTMLASFAHAYHWLDEKSYEQLPNALQQPWETISQRLGRRGLAMTFIEVHTYNWRLLDPTASHPRRLGNMRMLFPIFDIEDEHVFVLEPVEMHDYGAPIIGAVVRAQEAVQHDDPATLLQELTLIHRCLQQIAYESFAKIDLNPHSPTHVDPVVWAKTFGIFGLKIPAEAAQGAGGAAAPLYHLLDSFFERQQFNSSVGRESMRLRSWFPPHWQEFIDAAGQVSVRSYVERVGNRALMGAFQETFNALAGKDGILNRHRLKAYPFISMAVKAGRNTTVSGSFSGTLKERMWNVIDQELETTRMERAVAWPEISHQAQIKQVVALGSAQQARKVVLNIRNTGVTYRPGDLCAILPEQSDELIAKTLQALHATGDEVVQLNASWRAAVAHRPGYRSARSLPLRTVLRFGRIRPIDNAMVRSLYGLTHNPHLQQILADGSAEQWELWDLLELLTAEGFCPSILLQAPCGAQEHICCVVPPETFRTYSIASAAINSARQPATELQLTVGQLSYQSTTHTGRTVERRGTVAGFLDQVAAQQTDTPTQIAFQIIPSPHFALPQDSDVPIVMFAGGTGIAPFLSFGQERAGQGNAGEQWLYFATHDRTEIDYIGELATIAAQGKLHLHVAFSQDDVHADFQMSEAGATITYSPGQRGYIDRLMHAEEHAALLWELMRSVKEGGRGAHFYICGRTHFAQTVTATLKQIISRFITVTDEDKAAAAQQYLYHMVGEGRLSQDIFTTYTAPVNSSTTLYGVSELALHNDEEQGYWLAIDRAVYDVTEFLHTHPGGFKIIRSYAGMDGSEAFQKMGHHTNPGVMARLSMLQIGTIRKPNFGAVWGVGMAPDGLRPIRLQELYRAWVHFLYHIVEMENALHNNFDFQHRLPLGAEIEVEHSIFTLSQVVGFHNLFLQQYIPAIVGEDSEMLWTLTVSLCAPERDVRWMCEQNSQNSQSDAARAVARLIASFDTTVKAVGRGELTPNSAVILETVLQCRQLEVEAKRFMREVKETICLGVHLFEEVGEESIQQGNEMLLAAIAAIPSLLAQFYQRAAALKV